MEAPRMIFTGVGRPWLVNNRRQLPEQIEYTRKDLVDRLKGYATHIPGCNVYKGQSSYEGTICHPAPCTCGLTEVLKELE